MADNTRESHIDIEQRLEQWKMEATDRQHPSYGHADLERPVEMYTAISGLLNKLRETPENFTKQDVVALFGTLNSGQRTKNKVAEANALPQLREDLLTMLYGEGSAAVRIATASRAIRFAAENMLGELFGWAHAEEAPLHNQCATNALAYLGYTFDPRDYDEFVAAHEQFKKVYQHQVGHLRPDLPLNLEIDKLYNVIDKVDIKEEPQVLASSLSKLFRDWQEAEWAFELLAETLERLGVADPSDERFALTVVNEARVLRLNFGNWAVLSFYGPGYSDYRLGLPLVDGVVDLPVDYNCWGPFADADPSISVYDLPLEAVQPLDGQLRDVFEQALTQIANRFKDWKRSPYRRYNQQEIADAVFDPKARDHLLGEGMVAPVQRFWKIAPGADAWNWDVCHDGRFIAIGWDDLGDISDMSREEFVALRDELAAEREDWTQVGPDQVWTFAQIQEGDRIVANRGTTEILGIGTVTGPYHFVEGQRHGHRLPVHWDDVTSRQIDEPGWRRTLIELEPAKFEALSQGSSDESAVEPECPFSEQTFELLEGIHASPTKEYYQSRKDEFKAHVEEPFQRVFRQVAEHLRPQIKAVMETRTRLFARFLKNDWGQGGAWDFYWGAFYPKGGKRVEDAQLSMWMDHRFLEYGFYIGAYGSEQRKRFQRNCQEHGSALLEHLCDALPQEAVAFGSHDEFGVSEDGTVETVPSSWEAFLRDPASFDNDVSIIVPRQQLLATPEHLLVTRIVEAYEKLFPLVLMAVEDDPLPLVSRYLEAISPESDEEPEPLEAYDRRAFLARTYLYPKQADDLYELLLDKRQIILYGPPGTGKTYVARELAKWVTGLVDPPADRVEMIQFHPAYSYEDFIEGIRPESKPAEGGRFAVDYPPRPGVFRRFCTGAESNPDQPCVFIIDEINRGNIPRIFGELMLLLEYRDQDVALPYSGKRFQIPPNVYLIGTMNTADRSIALVDFALRRRFHFFHFGADPDLLERWLADNPPRVPYLANLYRRLSEEAIDDPDYAVGPSYFMDPNLTERKLERIWQYSIEPYLEEYFVEQRARLNRWRWDSDFLKGIRGEE